jgi:hypothetical protein
MTQADLVLSGRKRGPSSVVTSLLEMVFGSQQTLLFWVRAPLETTQWFVLALS